jgi:hypothetical protein
MDWTMVNNAEGPTHRVQTIFYLFRCRYERDARAAGMRLADEWPDNQLCRQTIAELRAELGAPSKDLGIAGVSDVEVRDYLARLLAAYDERAGEPK